MRRLEDVTEKNAKEIQSFASKALSDSRISKQAHDEIRESADQLLNMVYSAVGTTSETRRTAVRTARKRRQPKNREVADQLQVHAARREEKIIAR